MYRVFFLPVSAGPTAVVSFYLGYHHYDSLCNSRHRLLQLPDMRRKTQRWPSVGPAIIRQAWGGHPVFKRSILYRPTMLTL